MGAGLGDRGVVLQRAAPLTGPPADRQKDGPGRSPSRHTDGHPADRQTDAPDRGPERKTDRCPWQRPSRQTDRRTDGRTDAPGRSPGDVLSVRVLPWDRR